MLPTVKFSEVDFVLYLQAELREGEEREEGRHEHGHIEVRIVAEMEGSEVEGKQTLDEHPRQVDAFDAEEATGQHDDEECEKYTRNPPQSFVELLQKQLVGADEDALQSTVDHEVPRRTMSQTADEEAEPQVEVFARLSLHAATTQGEVEVIFNEYAEGLVPTTPKL